MFLLSAFQRNFAYCLLCVITVPEIRAIPRQAVRLTGTFEGLQNLSGIRVNLGDNVRVGVRTPERGSIPSNSVWPGAG